ncbi:MAG TPA: glycoside hydrolase family 20 zincin-like fold domain-containing protein, partial [Puia sp.]|nr:glycoside hydrolase family 20 zincin-like fold domain-containing protein [Puia sp.]
MRKFVLIAAICLSNALHAQEPTIIPRPVHVESLQGHFTITRNSILVADESDKPSADFFAAYLEEIYGLRLKRQRTAGLEQGAAQNVGQTQAGAQGAGPVNYIRLST